MKKPKWSKDQNPVRWYRKERNPGGPSPDVERWIFDQMYDYAVYLERKLSDLMRLPMPSDDLFAVGNVLKATFGTDDMPLFTMVVSGSVTKLSFPSVVLLDASEYYDAGELMSMAKHFDAASGFSGPCWELSSLKEVADAE